MSNDNGYREIADAITDKWTALKGRSITDCVRIYLTCTRKWPFFGAALFHAKVCSTSKTGTTFVSF